LVLTLFRQGHSFEEIGARQGRGKSWVYRR
jgi:hypothetical protein